MATQHKNPDKQIAIALGYDFGGEDLPKILAKGDGSIAEQIIELAYANGIKVREDQDLAELLSLIDIDSEIPVEAMVAVAEILAYVYRANGQSKMSSLSELNPYTASQESIKNEEN